MNSQDQAFPGTSDTRTAEEVEQHIREANARVVTAMSCDARGLFLDFEDGERVFYRSEIDHEHEDGCPIPAAISQHEADRARQEPVAELLGHLSDVLDDAAWEKIDTKKWNAVSSLVGIARTHPAPTNPAAQERETTLQRFNRHMEADAERPLERLRFFCSLAMTGQDWLDVEPFFTDVEAAQERAEPVAPAVQTQDNSELCKTLMQIARNDGAPSWSQRFALGQAIGRLSATPPAPAQPSIAQRAAAECRGRMADLMEEDRAALAQPSPEPSKPEQAEAPTERTGNAEVDRVLDRLDSSDPDFDDCAAAAALIYKLELANRGPDGFATWKEAAMDERMKRLATLPPAIAAGDCGAGERGLLPCPFCGNAKNLAMVNEKHDHSGGYYIACPVCDASTGLRYAMGDDPLPLLTEQWNRRAALATKPQAEQDAAARDVLAERKRQISAEGYNAAEDDEYGDGTLAQAAACYATALEGTPAPMDWPWPLAAWKPKAFRVNLVRAGALILAEIERLDRAARASNSGGVA